MSEMNLDALLGLIDGEWGAEAYKLIDNVIRERDSALSRLDTIERQSGDATEYVLAQINQRLRDECARWKQVAEEAEGRAEDYRKELEGQDGPYYHELRTARDRSEERVRAWANQARIDADMRFKAESRLETAVNALRAIRDGIPGTRLHATDALIAIGALDVRCGNANCNVLVSAGEPHVEGCLGRVVEKQLPK